jgi:hypothetical protein
MGSILLPARLLPPAPAHEAHEVGSVGRSEAPVMVVGRSDQGGPLVYRGEIKGHLWSPRRSYGDVCRMRVEIKVKQGNEFIKAGHQFVVAEHPYSNGWLHRTLFKSPCKKGPERREELLDKARGQGIADGEGLIQWIEALPYDFWEKGPFLTASISEPGMPPGVYGPREIDWKANVRLALGVCDDFDACVNELNASPEVKELLRQTESNVIRFWPRKVQPTVRPRLCDDLIKDALLLMDLSIRQALAGPHKHCQKFVGRAVTVKVDHIYRGHLYRRYRQVDRDRRKQQAYQEEILYRARGGRRSAGRPRRHDDDSP